MRVLQFVECFGGGMLTSVSQICNILAQEDIQVHLAYSLRPETPENFRSLLDSRVVLQQLDLTRNIHIFKDIKGLFAVFKIILQVEPDILHLHSSKAGFIGRLAAFIYRLRGKKIKVFYSPRGFSFLQKDANIFKRLTYLYLERIADYLGGTIIACSYGEGVEARKKLKARQVLVIENAVETSKIPLAVPSGKLIRVGISGRITPARNPELFMRIAGQLSGEQVQFVWIGGGMPEEEAALNRKLPNIEVTGWLPRDAALEKLSTLDIYLHTSRWEGMPLAVIEAMLAGLPVVVTDVVGNRDIVRHGTTGFIGRDEEEIVTYLKKLFLDKDLRFSMGKTAREEALKRFSLARLRRDILGLYNS